MTLSSTGSRRMPTSAASCPRVTVGAVPSDRNSAGTAAMSALSDNASARDFHAGFGSILTAAREGRRGFPELAARLEDRAERGVGVGIGRVELNRAPGVRLGLIERAARGLDAGELAQNHRARRRERQRPLEARLRLLEAARITRFPAGLDERLHLPEAQQIQAAPHRLLLRIDREDALERGDRARLVALRELGARPGPASAGT